MCRRRRLTELTQDKEQKRRYRSDFFAVVKKSERRASAERRRAQQQQQRGRVGPKLDSDGLERHGAGDGGDAKPRVMTQRRMVTGAARSFVTADETDSRRREPVVTADQGQGRDAGGEGHVRLPNVVTGTVTVTRRHHESC